MKPTTVGGDWMIHWAFALQIRMSQYHTWHLLVAIIIRSDANVCQDRHILFSLSAVSFRSLSLSLSLDFSVVHSEKFLTMVHVVLLERLKRKHLIFLVTILLIVQVIYFLVGGLIGVCTKKPRRFSFESLFFFLVANKPTYATNHEFSLCRSNARVPWIYHSPKSNCQHETLEFGSVGFLVNNIFLLDKVQITFIRIDVLGQILGRFCLYYSNAPY